MNQTIQPPRLIDDVDAFPWDDHADLIVVGLGGAGVAAALEALEGGAEVIALDRYEGGGSSAANGGVYYAGGGTSIQREAGEDDSAEQMYQYLKIEVAGVVGDRTVRRFCDESVATFEWLRAHGAPFNSKLWKKKTSYPPLDHFLYHPDSSLTAPYMRRSKPAARGHRTHMRNGTKPWGLGVALYAPLRDAALRLGLRFHRHAEVQQLAVDRDGRVVGVRALQVEPGTAQSARYTRVIAAASKWLLALPPTFPLAFLTIALGRWHLRRAQDIQRQCSRSHWYRARRGVLLSAGGFILDRELLREHAPRYMAGHPNGTLGDVGSGHRLGASAGGRLDLMDRISAWRFINPPAAWAAGMLINARGERFVNETLYGASIGDAVMAQPDGKAWLVFDAAQRAAALKQARDPQIVPFQRDVARLNLSFNTIKAATPRELAKRLGCDATRLVETLDAYNRIARGELDDPFEKRREECQPQLQGPYYAIDASIHSRLLPMATMTLGGLRVDEDSGRVLNATGEIIAGLYAAGRSAIGVSSNIYVSGLSYADCIFSGRTVGRHIAALL
ncbi:FAD-binding protein [Hydrocarboniphaga sp.]|uniref:FAD-binding protein n=1 Tax=Hydrocarboniphaga sp. TaxID=2033016 RepID=UPI003D13E488